MSIVTLTVDQFAQKIRQETCIILPVAVGGFVYAVVQRAQDNNIYRVAVA